jgi:hypothetical protein
LVPTSPRFAGAKAALSLFSLPVAVFVTALPTGPEQRSRRAARFEKNALSVLLIAAVALFFKPDCELIILAKEKFESFADDIGIGRIDELSVLMELRFDLLLDPNLERFILWWSRR